MSNLLIVKRDGEVTMVGIELLSRQQRDREIGFKRTHPQLVDVHGLIRAFCSLYRRNRKSVTCHVNLCCVCVCGTSSFVRDRQENRWISLFSHGCMKQTYISWWHDCAKQFGDREKNGFYMPCLRLDKNQFLFITIAYKLILAYNLQR